MGALLSHVSRSILISTIERAKPVEEISRDSGIPLSTCYEKVTELLRRGVLKRERIIVLPNGKRYALYRATIRTVHVEFGAGGLDIETVANGDRFGKSPSMNGLLTAKPIDAGSDTRVIVRRTFYRD